MKGTALILAGTRPGGDPLAEAEGVSHKSLLQVGEKTILARVIGALQSANAERIVVSTDNDNVRSLARELGVEIIEAAAGPSQSVALAFEQYGAPMLVTTSDHALLQGDWITDFLGDTPEDADIGVLMAQRDGVETAVPGSTRTWLNFADGQWSGCNLFSLQTPAARNALSLWRQVEADRKRPWRIARKLGFGTLIDYIFGRLSLADAVARLGAGIGLNAQIVEAREGLAAVDVDKPSDLALVRELALREQT